MNDRTTQTEQEHNWGTFSHWFSESFADFPFVAPDKAPQECPWKVGPSQIAVDQDFLRAEAPFKSAVENAIQRICCGKESSPPGMSPVVRYFLGLRVSTVNLFLQDMCALFSSSEEGEVVSTIIPFPSLSPQRIAEWFLIDWWGEHGPHRACEQRLLEETLPLE